LPTNVLMPKTGADETHGKLVKWLKREGDAVARGDVVAEIETDKVNMEVESFGEGRLYRILVKEGESQAVGKPIAILLKDGEEPPAGSGGAPEATGELRHRPIAPGAPAVAEPSHAPSSAAVTPVSGSFEQSNVGQSPVPAPSPSAAGEVSGTNGRIKASPLARKMAQSHMLDLGTISGRGPGGRVVREDVEAALKAGSKPVKTGPAGPQPAAPEALPVAGEPELAVTGEKSLSRIQLTTAKRLTESKQTAPHFYLTVEVDMAEAMTLRATLNEQAAGMVKISVNDLVVKACAGALQRHPTLNSSYQDGKLLLHDRVNIAVAIALDEGLISPVIPDADRKSLGQISREAKAMAERARAGRLKPDDLAEGTFTVSNLGMFDVDTFIAIINPPQAAILAVGAVRDVPVVRDGQLAVGKIMKMTLSADHRATDGAQGARFLADVRQALEKPLLMAL